MAAAAQSHKEERHRAIPICRAYPAPFEARQRRIPLSLSGARTPRTRRERVLRSGCDGVGSRFRGKDVDPGILGDVACAPSWRYRAEWIPAYAGMTAKRAGITARARARRWRPDPPLPIRGEDAANAAGKDTADGARSVPSFLRRQESIRRPSATTGRSPVSPDPPPPRHSRESGNLLLPLAPPCLSHALPYRESGKPAPTRAPSPQTARNGNANALARPRA